MIPDCTLVAINGELNINFIGHSPISTWHNTALKYEKQAKLSLAIVSVSHGQMVSVCWSLEQLPLFD